MTTQTRETTTLTRATGPPRPAAPAGADLPPRRHPPHRRPFTRHSTAGEVVLGYLDEQAAKLGVLDLAVRRDKPDSVHQMRVTVRRLRSTLQSFTGILSGPETEHLQAELKWLGGVLGDARDNEVLADQLHALRDLASRSGNEPLDLLCCFGRTLRQGADFGRHDREAAACVTGTRRFNAGVQCE